MDTLIGIAQGLGMAFGVWVVVEIWKEYWFHRKMSKQDKMRRMWYWNAMKGNKVRPLFYEQQD
jgi:hypothetical protein